MALPASHITTGTRSDFFTVEVAPACQDTLRVVSALLHACVDTCMTAGPADFERARELGLMHPASTSPTPQGLAVLRALGHAV